MKKNCIILIYSLVIFALLSLLLIGVPKLFILILISVFVIGIIKEIQDNNHKKKAKVNPYDPEIIKKRVERNNEILGINKQYEIRGTFEVCLNGKPINLENNTIERYTNSYTRNMLDNYTVIDLETTGLSFEEDEIIEIGAIKVRNNEIIDKFTTLVNPEKNISKTITRITGLTDELLWGKPEINEVIKPLVEFIGNDIIMAYNARFDLAFLNKFSKLHLDTFVNNSYTCPMRIAKKILAEKIPNFKLKTVKKFFKIENEGHRALQDCIDTHNIYQALKVYAYQNSITFYNRKQRSRKS